MTLRLTSDRFAIKIDVDDVLPNLFGVEENLGRPVVSTISCVPDLIPNQLLFSLAQGTKKKNDNQGHQKPKKILTNC